MACSSTMTIRAAIIWYAFNVAAVRIPCNCKKNAANDFIKLSYHMECRPCAESGRELDSYAGLSSADAFCARHIITSTSLCK